MNQSHTMQSSRADSDPEKSIRMRMDEAMELATRLKDRAQSMHDACFGTSPREGNSLNPSGDISSSLMYLTATLGDAASIIEGVLKSVESQSKPVNVGRMVG